MSGSSTRIARKRGTQAGKRRTTPLWKRVGAFVKARREELGLSQGDIIKALGYKSRNAVSNVEVGIEGLPAKRIYAWADILEVSRDAFYRFATGEVKTLAAATSSGEKTDSSLTAPSLSVALRRSPSSAPAFARERAPASSAPRRNSGTAARDYGDIELDFVIVAHLPHPDSVSDGRSRGVRARHRRRRASCRPPRRLRAAPRG